jgi:hypothetical protein
VSAANRALAIVSGHCRVSLWGRLFHLWARVVVGELEADFASVLPLALQLVPAITLAAAGYDDSVEIQPRFSYEFGLLVVVEHGDLELVVVWRVMYSKSKFLVPKKHKSVSN